MLDKLQLGGIIVVVMFAIGVVYNYEVTIARLIEANSEIADDLYKKSGDLVVAEANNLVLNSTILDMNKQAEALANKYESAMAKYKVEKNKPAKVRYEVLYKYTTKEDSNDCEDIKRSIDGLSSYVNKRMQ